MAFHMAILLTTCLPYPTSILPGIDPHCPGISTSVSSTAALARAGLVLCHVHGFLSSHLQATERAVLDVGYRVAVLFAFAMVGIGHAPGSMADQATLSPERNHLVATAVDCLEPLLTLL